MKTRLKDLVSDGRNFVIGIGLVACAVLSVIWWGTFTRIANEKSLTIESAVSDGNNIAAIVEANLNEVLDRAKLYARRSVPLAGHEHARPSLNALISDDPAYLRAAVFTRGGQLLQSSTNRTEEPELRKILQDSLSDAAKLLEEGQLIIVRPPREGSSSWRVPVMIRFSTQQIAEAYFIAVIDLGYFLRFYRGVTLGDGGRIEVLMRDGYQLVEMNGASLAGGANYRDTDYAGFLAGDFDTGIMSSPRPGEARTEVSVFRISQTHPFAIVVSRDESDLVQNLSARHWEYLIGAMVFSLFLTALLLVLVFIALRQRRLYQGLTISEHENQNLIALLEEEKGRALWQASHDYLTGIPNRMLFNELASTEIARAKRSRKLYALLFLDLDKFKQINDSLGHSVGDLLLKAVARRLRESLREYDLLARLGGDEFVILLSEMTSEADVSRVAAKLVDVVSKTYKDLEGQDVDVSPSIGIALYPRDGKDLEELLTHADFAMYMAKSAGAGTYRFFDMSLNASSIRASDLLARFKTALKENEFLLHFQPRISLDDYSVQGMEALVRWQHPSHGLVFPNDFIPLAEANDLIVPLGHWVVEAACRQLHQWREQDVPLVPIAINVSPKQLRNEALLDAINTALRRYDIPPELLEIEVTEGCFIEDFDMAHRLLKQIRALGIKVALDDYGTGFSSLKNLARLPIHAIKIDRSFIQDIRNDTNDAVIVASTITLAHSLGLEVIAEGVESREQLMHLKTAGCDHVQGFYFQRPVSADDIVPTLQRGRFSPL